MRKLEVGIWKWEYGSGNMEVGSRNAEVGSRKWECGSRNATNIDANMVPGAVLLVFKENAVVCHEVSKVADLVSCRWVSPETAFKLPALSKTAPKARA